MILSRCYSKTLNTQRFKLQVRTINARKCYLYKFKIPVFCHRYGKIQGRIHSLPGNDDLAKVEVYHGIPYATPPVSSNR